MSNKQVVFITGTSTGFGRLAAESLARQGYAVYASLRDKQGKNAKATSEMEALAKKENLTLKVVELDVTDTNSVNKAIDYVVSDAGRIDVLVNNAGVLYSGILEAYTDEQVFEQMNTNFFGIVRTNRAALPHMRKQKSGLLIHITSDCGRMVMPFFGIYSASKFATEALAETYRYELAHYGVDSVIVEPGPFPTEMPNRVFTEGDEKVRAEYKELISHREKMSATIAELMSGKTPPNSMDVVNAIQKLIEMPAGTRPLRTSVGSCCNVAELNKAMTPFTENTMKAFGFTDMAKLKTPSVR